MNVKKVTYFKKKKNQHKQMMMSIKKISALKVKLKDAKNYKKLILKNVKLVRQITLWTITKIEIA